MERHLFLGELGMMTCPLCGKLISNDPIAIKHQCKGVSLSDLRGAHFNSEEGMISNIKTEQNGTTETVQ